MGPAYQMLAGQINKLHQSTIFLHFLVVTREPALISLHVQQRAPFIAWKGQPHLLVTALLIAYHH